MSRRGMTLLEVLVALVILGLVGAAFLELFGNAVRGASEASVWSQAVAYATDGMERLKLDPATRTPGLTEQLPGGFARRIEQRPWDDGLTQASVVVTFPDARGGRYVLQRLVRAR